MGWRPLSQRNVAGDSDYDALHSGVPPWLKGSLLRWLSQFFGGLRSVNTTRIHEVERRLRVSINAPDDLRMLQTLHSRLSQSPEFLLNVVDLAASWAVRDSRSTEEAAEVLTQLDAALTEAGSEWRVQVLADPPDACLERRVDETVTRSARDVMGSSARAGEYLAKAWHEVYGRDPSPGEAYRHAVRAVEVAVLPIVIPNDRGGTLGKAITAMRDAPRKWRVALTPSDGSDPVDAVRRMLELLWRSQWDRHGIPDESAPLDVSQEEAEGAVHLATTLVWWFTGGAVASADG